MPLDQTLVGHVTQPQTATITPDAIRQFVDAIGDRNPVYRDSDSAQSAGFARIPAPPTFVTRFRVPFDEAGLDTAHSQVLHGEQGYVYTRPLYAGETLTVRHRIASIRQSSRAGGMAIMVIEQLGDTQTGDRVVTGKSTVIVRDAPPPATPAATSRPPKDETPAPARDIQPALTKHVTQSQINAYADVSGDHNPIHLDPAAARSVGLDGTIAHGMLSMAFLGEMVTSWATSVAQQPGWVSGLTVHFQAMVRPEDDLRCFLTDSGTDTGESRLAVWIENDRGERVIVGEAVVTPFSKGNNA